MMTGITLDAGALIAVDRGDRGIGLMLQRCAENSARVTIPATALAQVARAPRRQARLMRLVRHETTDVVALNLSDAVNVGQLLAATRTSDVTDAHVVVCARRADQPILTSDPGDLRALDPRAILITV